MSTETPQRPIVDADPTPGVPRRTALIIMAVFVVLAVAATTFGSDLLRRAAATTDGDFAGETLEVLIPLAEGGGTDTWARYVGTELSHTVPGQPGFAPVNEPGGEGIAGTNDFVASARPDGTEILVSTASSVVPWVLGRSEVQYDFSRLTPVVANGTGGVIYARTAAGVDGVEDLRDPGKPLTFGGISATGLDLTTLVAFDVLGVDVNAIFGFEGRGPVGLALQRGEVDLDYQTTSAYQSTVQPLVEAGDAVPLASFGQLDPSGEVVRDPNFPDIPTVGEVAEQLTGEEPSGPAWEAYKTLLGVTYTYQKGMWVKEETPVPAVNLLRQSARELSQDPAFEERAAEVLGGYPLLADADLAQTISEAYRVDDEVRSYVTELLETDYDVQLD